MQVIKTAKKLGENANTSEIVRPIDESPNKIHDFSMAANIQGVKLICEVGFDLGHSAGLFLLTTNPTVQLISFDTGKSEWSDGQVDYVKSMFPGRFKYVKGEYRTRIKEYAGYAKSNSKYRCDLWSIGIGQSSMDSETSADDMLNTAAIAVAAKRSYILASSFNRNSLYYAISHHPPICHIDVYILTDRDNFPAMRNLVDMYGVKILEVPYEADLLRSAKLKIKNVFSIPEISSYDAVLFVDIAILFNVRDIGEVMSVVTSDRYKLHILQEQSSSSTSSYYSTGMYVFQPNSVIKSNFETVGNDSSSYSNENYRIKNKKVVHTRDLFSASQVRVTREVFVLSPAGDEDSSSTINNNINNNNNNDNDTDSSFSRGLLRFERLSRMVSFSKKHLPWISSHTNANPNRGGQEWTHRDNIEKGDCAVLFNLMGRASQY
eukprot:gene29581-38701_t